MKKGNIFLLTLVTIFVAGGLLFWYLKPMNAMPQALESMKSNHSVKVTYENWITFTPRDATPTVGFIFYPGAKVDPRSYAPEMSEIASHGFLTVIVPMPLNLAIFGVDKAGEVIKDYPYIKKWVIGGHSLGGVMAVSYAKSNKNKINGIVLWASYPDDSDDLSNSSIPTLVIYATNDGLATPQKIEDAKHLLPQNTEYVRILGGDHAQFGWYGDQDGDNPATITRSDQQKIIVNATLNFLIKRAYGITTIITLP
ncbi:MAG: alpha/beta hydrolase [Athalassotoga sp.]|uniref:alpha/beta hydrolase n=1 Tax=Athalassotoga sp. TaxID=2022597 RepID=UPI001767C3DA|nr:alpha/beta hydrolase [Thermodesulfobium narugense]